ncbi:hypothetical protein C6501_15965 [Candidatus Poribacteria bacterium]|nr:MAG: hypothetical protein C6501_15965 [Candidatus Poribacteria bacterium]
MSDLFEREDMNFVHISETRLWYNNSRLEKERFTNTNIVRILPRSAKNNITTFGSEGAIYVN